MRTVDKLDKIGAEKVHALLTDDWRRVRRKRRRDPAVHRHHRQQRAGLSALEGYRAGTRRLTRAWTELKTVVKYLAAFGVPEENFAVDLTIARGLDYYTGTVYETAAGPPGDRLHLLRRPV